MRSISPGRRAGEPLPVPRQLPPPLRLKRLCAILGIAGSSFHHWRATAADRATRQAANARLATLIRAVHRKSDGTYGVPRITAELRDEAERVDHERVARVMRSTSPAGVRLRRRHRTTIADPTAAVTWDPVGHDFTAAEEHEVAAISPISLWTAGSSSIWPPSPISPHAASAIADHLRTDLVTDVFAPEIASAESVDDPTRPARWGPDHRLYCFMA
ncbi:IS3 family transposase [Streptomyces adustus]|uniref:IS3 family transposase n=1 Tax=Streptomyces adustus TaxID=1609272 RepID=UPI003710C18C